MKLHLQFEQSHLLLEEYFQLSHPCTENGSCQCTEKAGAQKKMQEQSKTITRTVLTVLTLQNDKKCISGAVHLTFQIFFEEAMSLKAYFL